MYAVNYLTNFDSSEDRCFDDIQDAYAAARALCEDDTEAAYGVWQGETLLAIVFEGEVYTR